MDQVTGINPVFPALAVPPPPGASSQLAVGELVIDLAAWQVRHDGRAVPLGPNEFRLLAGLMANPDRLLTRSQIIELVGKDPGQIDERTVDVWIGRLRRALRRSGACDPLRTVHSLGYVLDSTT